MKNKNRPIPITNFRLHQGYVHMRRVENVNGIMWSGFYFFVAKYEESVDEQYNTSKVTHISYGAVIGLVISCFFKCDRNHGKAVTQNPIDR